MVAQPGQAGVQITEEMIEAGARAALFHAGGHLEGQEDRAPEIAEAVLRESDAFSNLPDRAGHNAKRRLSALLGEPVDPFSSDQLRGGCHTLSCSVNEIEGALHAHVDRAE